MNSRQELWQGFVNHLEHHKNSGEPYNIVGDDNIRICIRDLSESPSGCDYCGARYTSLVGTGEISSDYLREHNFPEWVPCHLSFSQYYMGCKKFDDEPLIDEDGVTPIVFQAHDFWDRMDGYLPNYMITKDW